MHQVSALAGGLMRLLCIICTVVLLTVLTSCLNGQPDEPITTQPTTTNPTEHITTAQTTLEETTPEETTPEETTPAVTEPDFANPADPDGTKRY